jgi:hypothetical protein
MAVLEQLPQPQHTLLCLRGEDCIPVAHICKHKMVVPVLVL